MYFFLSIYLSLYLYLGQFCLVINNSPNQKKKILFNYLTEIASKRGNTSRGSGRGRSRLTAQGPDVGLDPTTPGSRPEPKADAQPLCHPRAPGNLILSTLLLTLFSSSETTTKGHLDGLAG